MSEISEQQVPTSGDHTSDAGGRFNMSMETVPTGWVEAQHESPVGSGDGSPLPRTARFSTIPTGSESAYIANVTALGAAFISGTIWYMTALFDIYDGPWIATVVAAVIALAVRFAGGADRTYRAALSLTFFLLTVLIVLLLITHQQLIEVYGSAGGFQQYEDTLVNTRLKQPAHLVAYGLGALLAVQISFLDRSGQ